MNRRKTKSERDKKRKGSLPDAYHEDSESETSDDTKNNPKYRRRASCKRNELADNENLEHRLSRGPPRRGSAQLICNAAQDPHEDKAATTTSTKKVETRQFRGRQRRDSRINSFVVFNYSLEPNNGIDHHSSGEPNTAESTLLSIDVNPLSEVEKENDDEREANVKTANQNSNSDNIPLKHKRPDSFTRANIISITSIDENSDVVRQNVGNGKDSRPSSTTTLKMNLKDIYNGTWDAKEKAVFNLVLQNLDTETKDGTNKKNLINKFKKTHHRTNSLKEENIYSIKECLTPREGQLKQDKKAQKGLLSGGFKWIRNVFKPRDRPSKILESEYVFPRDPLLDLITPKKKSIFKRFRSNKKNKRIDSMRRRAQSTNSHYSVEYLLNPNQSEGSIPRMHGSLGTLTSVKGIFNKKTNTKEDNLNGAFEFFANQTHVFQRTASVSRRSLKSRHVSCEQLDVSSKRGTSNQTDLNHIFEPVKKREEHESKKKSASSSSKTTSSIASSSQKKPTQSISRNMQYDYLFDDVDIYTPPSQSVPNYSYMSPDACLPYSTDLYHDDDVHDVTKYTTRGTCDSGFGTAFSNISSEDGLSSGKNVSYKNKIASIPCQRASIPEQRVCVTVHEDACTDELLLNSFHQRRPKKQYGYNFV